MSSSPSHASVGFFIPSASRSSSTAELSSPHSISTAPHSLLQRLSHSSIFPDSSCRLAIADSGATHRMFPDKAAFISYKATSELKVQMGNNSYLPILGRGSSIISLNGQRFLFGMLFMSRVLRCLYIASELTSNSQDAVLLEIMMPVCWYIFPPLCSRLTHHPIALSPTSLLAGPLHCRPFTTSSLGVVHLYTPPKFLCLHTRSHELRC
jgi:hypothetical protein